MRQAGKGGQRLEAAGSRQTRGIRQRQRRQGVAVVVLAGYRHLFDVQHFLTLHPQPGFSLLAVKVVVADVNAKANTAVIGPAHRHRQSVIGIHNAALRIFINAQLGRPILLQAERVAVHMIFGHVEDRRRNRPQAGGGFQLEAGKFENVQLAFSIQQHQGRQANIAADADVYAGRFRHFTHQGGDGAFTV